MKNKLYKIFSLFFFLAFFLFSENLKAQDSDGDGYANSVDLDDDNDGILDAAEGQCTSLSKTSSWSASGTQATATAGSVGINFNSTPLAGTNTNHSYMPTGTFNATNFWYSTGIAGASSLEFVHTWDNTPETPSGTALAATDGGTRQVTITFSTPINKLLLNVDRLGGNAGTVTDYISNSAEFTLTTANTTITKLTGNSQLIVSGNKFYRFPNVNLGTTLPGGEANLTTGTAAGTVQIVKNDGSSFTSLTFSIAGIGAEGSGNDGIEMIFEACNDRDTDGDGTPDYLDLDSDNDGCLDAREGDENVLYSQLVTASGPVTVGAGSSASNQNLGITVDANGVPTVVNSGGAADIGPDQGQGIGVSQDSTKSDCIDSDGDGVADWSDLDDDNDGILDTNEAKCSTLGAETYSSINTITEAQIAQSVTLQSTSNANTPFATNTSYTINYGTGNGKKITAINFASGKKLSLLSNSQTMNFYVRRNTSSPLASNEILWLESAGTSLTSAQNILLSKPVTLQSVFSNGYYNAGFDNVFSNDSATNPSFSNIERLDVIFTTPFISVNPTTDYVLLTERGVNDNILVAAVTAVDGSGVPTSLGSVQTIST